MKELKFNKEYYMPILAGEKTQTMRRNKKRVRPDDVVLARFNGTDFTLKLKITKMGYKQMKYVNDDDAKREGFESAEELKKALTDIYPTIDNLTRLYWYQFKCIE